MVGRQGQASGGSCKVHLVVQWHYWKNEQYGRPVPLWPGRKTLARVLPQSALGAVTLFSACAPVAHGCS
jgi:hypothetical protein